ncbi:MAG: patatin family protein [Lachnospiraceae bacterium]|nr:patatin family protein [Lachnospiraceae bacterium]
METKKSKIGIIDVGGGMRDVYAAGVLETCLEQGILFDYCIGISAGSGNLLTYLAGQKGRNYKFYAEYVFRKEYISLWNFLRNRNYINLDYAYGVLSNSDGENPLDYAAFARTKAEYYVVACNALTGETKYFDRRDVKQDCYDILKASSTLPVVCRPYVVDGIPYYDGGFADPVPVAKAFADGCDKVVLVLSRPADFVRVPDKDVRVAKKIRKKYPRAAEELSLRYKKYNDGVALAKEYAKQGKLLLIAPDDCCGVDTLTKDKENMKRLFEKGQEDGKRIRAFVSGTR